MGRGRGCRVRGNGMGREDCHMKGGGSAWERRIPKDSTSAGDKCQIREGGARGRGESTREGRGSGDFQRRGKERETYPRTVSRKLVRLFLSRRKAQKKQGKAKLLVLRNAGLSREWE